jgi:hypothetical protein
MYLFWDIHAQCGERIAHIYQLDTIHQSVFVVVNSDDDVCVAR